MGKPMITAVTAAVLSCGLAGGFTSGQSLAAGTLPYQNAGLPVSARVDDLISRMTLEEKLAQLQTLWHQRRAMETSAELGDDGLQFIAEVAAQSLPEVLATLSELELMGLVENRAGTYQRC